MTQDNKPLKIIFVIAVMLMGVRASSQYAGTVFSLMYRDSDYQSILFDYRDSTITIHGDTTKLLWELIKSYDLQRKKYDAAMNVLYKIDLNTLTIRCNDTIFREAIRKLNKLENDRQ